MSLDRRPSSAPLKAMAAPDTTVLVYWTFDGGGCVDEGWISVDRTAQIDTFFHVDDFAGLGGGDFGRLVPLEGSQSLWCGARPTAAEPLCAYATLPGYGNHWDQHFQTTNCFTVSGNAYVDFLASWDTEPAYDYVSIQVEECGGGLTTIVGDWPLWDDQFNGFRSTVIYDSLFTDSIRVRIRFESDVVYSDEDGVWDTDGAVILDSLTIRDTTGVVLPTELFEVEALGAKTTVSGNWTAGVGAAFGDFAGLFDGTGVVQEDPCVSNLSCFWGFFSGSTRNYGCGGHPAQLAVPRPNWTGYETLYITNEIWSPWIPLVGGGGTFEVAFDVYRDLALESMIFYNWYVRFSSGGCPTLWMGSEVPYFGDQKDWFRLTEEFSTFVPPGATSVQLAIGIFDGCQYWYCFGEYCRSHAPLIDNVEVRRIDSNGPRWLVRDIDLFQDNFAADGTTTGTVRADAALDLLPGGDPNVRLADSVVVHVANPEGRIAADAHGGNGPAVYTYVQVRPTGQPGKSGDALSSDPSRWPVVDSLTYAGEWWYCLRMDSALTGGEEPDTAFCIDLNDNLFTPGDTIFYIFGAIADQPAVEATYYSRFTGTTDDMPYALDNPMEFTCLPTLEADFYYPTGPGGLALPVLYVDGADGQGVQPYFDAAFAALGITYAVDRFDVLYLPPGAHVSSVAGQLLPAYRKIIWSAGDDISPGIGEASGKFSDATMLKEFLDSLPGPGGVYLTGDNIAGRWGIPSVEGAALRDAYIQHTLVSGDHVDAGLGVSPQVFAVGGGMFDHVVGDHLVAYGGCPTINDFDVILPQGTAQSEMLYAGSASHPAIISQRTDNLVLNPGPISVGVVLSGFSFHEVQDAYTNNQPTDPSHHLDDILQWLAPNIVNDASTRTPHRNSLAQNYPNPFNPTTTVEFTVKERARVRLSVYNVRGQLVKTLVDDERAPGVVHKIVWKGDNNAGQSVASGVYFYRLATKGYTKTRKMVLLK